jgi:hypothetical protein
MKIKETVEIFTFELLIKADSKNNAEAVLHTDLKLKDDKIGFSFKKLNDYQLATLIVRNNEYIDDTFYDAIKKSKKIAIIKDGFRHIQQKEVGDKVYEVENELRKILLYTSDFIEAYYNLFQKAKGTKSHVANKSLVYQDDIDPIVSRLELGEMINILGVDLNSTSEQLTRSELREIFETNNDFESCKKEIIEKYKVRTVWQAISDNLLENKGQKWCDIKKKLDEFRKLRNKIAHYRVLTPKDKKRIIELGDDILESIKIKLKVGVSDIRNLEESFASLRDAMSGMLSQYNFDYLKGMNSVISGIMSQYDFSSMKELSDIMVKSISPLVKSFDFSAAAKLANLQFIDSLGLTRFADIRNLIANDDSGSENHKIHE